MKFLIKIVINFMCLTLINSEELILIDDSNIELIEQVNITKINEIGDEVDTIENYYKVKDATLEAKLDEIRMKFINNQNNVFKKIKNNIKDYQKSRNENLEYYTAKIDALKQQMYNDLANLNDQKIKKEQSIELINENMKADMARFAEIASTAEEEYRAKLQKLQDRKYYLNALITQHCDNCDEIREHQLDVHLAQNEKDILDLDENFLMQVKENKKLMEAMELSSAKELNTKYLELNIIMQKIIQEQIKLDEVNQQKENIINEWKIYSQNIENLHSMLETKINDVTNSSFNFDQVNSNGDNSTVLYDEGMLETSTQQDSLYFTTLTSEDSNNDSDTEDGNSETDNEKTLLLHTQENRDVDNNEDTSFDLDTIVQNEFSESTSEASVSERQKCFMNSFGGRF